MPSKSSQTGPERRTRAYGGDLRRPAEKVLHYVLSEFDGPDLPARLPSIRQLARQLSVSAATVQGVFQRLAKEGRIRVEVGNGSFLVAPPEEERPVYKIGTNVPVHPGGIPDEWTYKIYAGILHGTLQASRPVAIRPLPPEALQDERNGEEFLKNSREMDGFILLPNLVFDRRLQRICNETGRPYVHLNPPTEVTTADFVSPDYFGGSRRLGEAFRKAGRRRVALVMWPAYDDSVSVRLRCAGMAAGLMKGLDKTALRLYVDKERSCYDVVRQILENDREIPDAMYFAGDAPALDAIKAIEEKGLRVPEDVSVVGGNGLGFNTDPARRLTGLRHPLERLGEEVVGMLCKRLERGGTPVPGRFLPVDFNIGDTTLPEENAVLTAGTKGKA